jgi:ribosomal protein S18 acetylase RimI-like enzyme
MSDADLQFRQAVATDLAELHALVERAYRGDTARVGWTHEADLVEGPRTTAEALRAILLNPRERLLIALQDTTIVGCVQLSDRDNETVYIGLLTVDPQRQAGGLGKQLLAAAESEAQRSFGARTMELSVIAQRAELIAYYERRGFVRTGERRPFPIEMVPPLELVVLAKPVGNPIASH